MIFKCFRCDVIGFHQVCNVCGREGQHENVILDPKWFPETAKPLPVNERNQLSMNVATHPQIGAIVQKYKQFERPYFVSFVNYVGSQTRSLVPYEQETSLALFQKVLVRLGFQELKERPGFTWQLALTTLFRLEYKDFAAQISHHVSDRLESTLKSWVEERGASFRYSLPMFLYYLWENGLCKGELQFSEVMPLVADGERKRIYELCEQIYFDIQVTRFQHTLENLDSSQFVTMYTLDGMAGYEFEDFLGKLLTTIGYDVQVTKRTGDQGADLFAERFGRKVVIQAKNYYDSVGNSAIQQVLSAKLFYGCDEAMVITNSYFTPSAKELADATGVRLVDRTQLQMYLDEYNQTVSAGSTHVFKTQDS